MSSAGTPQTDDDRHREFSGQVVKIVTAGMVVLAAVWGAYAAFFGRTKVSGDPASWGQFGDFVGGVANPILSFFALIMISLTVILQSRHLNLASREMELSRRELEYTRQELSRSAHAQEQTEAALRAQAAIADRSARLSATNLLLGYYREEFEVLRKTPMKASDPRMQRQKDLGLRRVTLEKIMDDLYIELAKGVEVEQI